MIDREKILKFIARFKGSEEVFLHGCCYWFAHILEMRFLYTGMVTIMHDQVEGHFIARIGDRYYDIRGDVTELYRGKPLCDMDELVYEDSSMYQHLMRDCRDFEEVEEDV
jgi:hypothetical protein